MQAESKTLKRKVRPGAIDVHPTENAIVVHYSVEASIVGADDQAMAGERKAMEKLIRVKNLNADSDVTAVAQEIVDSCKLIHPSKLPALEQLLYYLQRRQNTSMTASDEQMLRKKLMQSGQDYADEAKFQSETSEVMASLDDMDSYIELLYEEIPDRVRGTAMILQLARSPENIRTLIENESLISALSRVLLEDGKRTFRPLHRIITQNKLGDACMKIIDHEAKRAQVWRDDISAKRQSIGPNPTADAKNEIEKEMRKMSALMQKQDRLLFVSFHLLLNLAEDLNIESKMVKRGIVGYLIGVLDRQTPELLLLALTFLKKLSIFKENKNAIVKEGDSFVGRLMDHILSEDQDISKTSIRFAINMSHDASFRSICIRRGALPKLTELLQRAAISSCSMILCLLYQLSVDDRAKTLFTYTNIIPQVMRMILDNPSGPLPIELYSLAINLAQNYRNAELMCEPPALKFLIRRATKNNDYLLLKVLHALSQHESIKPLFLEFIDDLVPMLPAHEDDQQVECTAAIIGILANMNIPDFDYAQLNKSFALLARIDVMINDHSTDDDLLLQLVMLVGTMAADPDVAREITRSSIIKRTMDMLLIKQDDDEMVLQIIFVTYQLLTHDETKKELLSETNIVSYLIDLLYDNNEEVRRLCDLCLDIISEFDEQWNNRIREQKFHMHNIEWLTAFENQGSQQDVNGARHLASNGMPLSSMHRRKSLASNDLVLDSEMDAAAHSEDEAEDDVAHFQAYMLETPDY